MKSIKFFFSFLQIIFVFRFLIIDNTQDFVAKINKINPRDRYMIKRVHNVKEKALQFILEYDINLWNILKINYLHCTKQNTKSLYFFAILFTKKNYFMMDYVSEKYISRF